MRLRSCVVAAVAACASSAMADFHIVNGGFEHSTIPYWTFTTPVSIGLPWEIVTEDPVPGWRVYSQGSGVNAGVHYPGIDQYPEGVPEGVRVAFSDGWVIEQTLDSGPTTPGAYTLLVDVGNRLDIPFMGEGYTIQLLLGERVVAEDVSMFMPERGRWLTSALTYTHETTVGTSEPEVFTIRMWGAAQANFDNVRLVPTPGALALAGAGVLGLTRRRR